MHKYLIARKVPKMEWVVIASTYLETNIAQHWDVLAMEFRTDEKIRYYGKIFRSHLSVLMEVLTRKWLPKTSSIF